jgi:hypothetical protein
MAPRVHRIFVSISVLVVLISCGACTRAELVSKADAYDEAIWDSNNKQILLNAVRASQRAPMSYVGFGGVLASPNFSGNAGGAFNLSPAGLTNYSLNPAVSYNGGFASFSIDNLNHSDFARKMHDPIDRKLIKYFHSLNWPREIVNLLLVHSIETTKAGFEELKRFTDNKCQTDRSDRTLEICAQLDEDRKLDADCRRRGAIETDGPRLTILNSARERCSMNKFQYALRMYRLQGQEEFPGKPRSPEGIVYYLGELIAAQNYSSERYIPETFVASGGRRRLVKLFVVERGASANAAVQVYFNGEGYYIPRPQLGSVDEERSLQVLDLVSQAITMATSKKVLPQTNSVSLIAVR